jgi:hypothetical protein
MDSPATGSNSQKVGKESTTKVTTQKKPHVPGAKKTSTAKSPSRKAPRSREGPAAPEATVNKPGASGLSLNLNSNRQSQANIEEKSKKKKQQKKKKRS